METRPRQWAWAGRLRPEAADRLLVGVLLLLGLTTFIDLRAGGEGVGGVRLSGGPAVALGVVFLLTQTVPLLWRRSRASAVLLLVACSFGAKVLLGLSPGIAGLGLLIAMYSVAAYERGRLRILFLVLAGCAFLAGFIAFGISGNPHWFGLTIPSLFFAAAWLIGDYLRTRRAYVAQLEERAARMERERDQVRRLAADEERARIARELHDVVAHHVSVIAIQAGAARAVQASKPEAAASALNLIEVTARQTLGELSQLLGVLRRSGGAAPERTPQPGMAQLGVLVEELRAAGLIVDVRIEGQSRPLPPAVDLSAYRILQEATTNVLKHARARRVEIRIEYSDRFVALDVGDDGTATGGEQPASGHGLIGMRERVALFGGELSAGPEAKGGFGVHARIPLGTDP